MEKASSMSKTVKKKKKKETSLYVSTKQTSKGTDIL